MKILVIRLRYIGDVILTMPFLKALRKLYPTAEITFMTGPTALELIKGCPYIDSKIIYDKDSSHSTFFNRLRFIHKLRKEKFDMAFVLQRSFSSAFYAWIANIPVRVGFDTEARGVFLTHRACYDKEQYEPVAFMENLRVLGHDTNTFSIRPEIFPEFKPGPQLKNFVEEIKNKKRDGKKIVVFNSGPGNSPKYWPKESFARLGNILVKYLDVFIVIVWGPAEKGEAQKIISLLNNFNPLARSQALLAPETSLSDLAFLLKGVDLLVTTDSGPMHIAVAQNIPSVTVFGPTNPVKWASPNKAMHRWVKCFIKCWPCDYNRCEKGWHCMKMVTPEMVYEQARTLLVNKITCKNEFIPVPALISGNRNRVSYLKTNEPSGYIKNSLEKALLPDFEISSIKAREKFSSKKNILVVETSSVGEVVLITPAISALRAAYPKARITALVIPSTKSVIQGNPFIDEIICYDKSGLHRGLLRAVLFGMSLKKYKFDLVLLFHRSFRSAVISYFTNACDRVGVSFEARGFLVNNIVPNRGNDYQHEIDRNMDVIREIGIDPKGTKLYFHIPEQAIDFSVSWMKNRGVEKNDRLAALYPGAGWNSKRWPIENFCQLGRQLLENGFDWVLVFWGPNEFDLAKKVVSGIGDRALLAPETDLKQLGAFMLCSNVLIANDTGPMHIGAAIGIPQVVIMGPTRPERWGPVTQPSIVLVNPVECGPCNKRNCSHLTCLKSISPEQCLNAVQKLLKIFLKK